MNKIFWLLIKVFLTIYLAKLIPVYYRNYGIFNFLWLSDVGLFLTVFGIWSNSNLLVSMAAVGVIFLELMWNVDFFVELFFHVRLINLAGYMFDNSYSPSLRALSLFHVFMPIIWILYILNFGYNAQALYYFVPLYWVILIIVYFLSKKKENINWVFVPKILSRYISEKIWILILFIFVPLFIFLPTHCILLRISG